MCSTGSHRRAQPCLGEARRAPQAAWGSLQSGGPVSGRCLQVDIRPGWSPQNVVADVLRSSSWLGSLPAASPGEEGPSIGRGRLASCLTGFPFSCTSSIGSLSILGGLPGEFSGQPRLRTHALSQWSPTCLAPGTSFVEDSFSTDRGWGCVC